MEKISWVDKVTKAAVLQQWWFGLVVASLGESTKLPYFKPG